MGLIVTWRQRVLSQDHAYHVPLGGDLVRMPPFEELGDVSLRKTHRGQVTKPCRGLDLSGPAR